MFPCWHQLKMKMHVFFCLSLIQHRAAQRRRWRCETVCGSEVRQGLWLKCQQSWSQAALLHCDPVTSWCRCSCLTIKLQYRWSQWVGEGWGMGAQTAAASVLFLSWWCLRCTFSLFSDQWTEKEKSSSILLFLCFSVDKDLYKNKSKHMEALLTGFHVINRFTVDSQLCELDLNKAGYNPISPTSLGRFGCTVHQDKSKLFFDLLSIFFQFNIS